VPEILRPELSSKQGSTGNRKSSGDYDYYEEEKEQTHAYQIMNPRYGLPSHLDTEKKSDSMDSIMNSAANSKSKATNESNIDDMDVTTNRNDY